MRPPAADYWTPLQLSLGVRRALAFNPDSQRRVMSLESPPRPLNSFARLRPGEIFAVNVVGVYGAGALIRDLLGVVHLSWFAQTGVAWQLGGAVSFALASHYWSRRHPPTG